MHVCNLVRIAVVGGLVLLSACGGGDSDTTTTTTAAATDTATQSAFVNAYGMGVVALATYGGLTDSGFVDLFDDAFLDAGYTKAQVRSNLAQEAAASAVAPDLSSFAAVKLSNVTIANCDAANVCVLTATVTNSDVDTTAVAFTTQVKFSNGKFRLYGDQKNA